MNTVIRNQNRNLKQQVPITEIEKNVYGFKACKIE